jgi:predicted enzyme related to lactoylglutathione lyase
LVTANTGAAPPAGSRVQQDMEGVGRFGWATDPDGNRVELWQPTEQS